MGDQVKSAMALREADRREIESQIEAFLKQGGKIEQIPQPVFDVKPKGCVWRTSYSSFER